MKSLAELQAIKDKMKDKVVDMINELPLQFAPSVPLATILT